MKSNKGSAPDRSAAARLATRCAKGLPVILGKGRAMRPDEVERRGRGLLRPLWCVAALLATLPGNGSAAEEDAAKQRDREAQRRAALAILEAGGGIEVTTRHGISYWTANIHARSKDFLYVHYVWRCKTITYRFRECWRVGWCNSSLRESYFA